MKSGGRPNGFFRMLTTIMLVSLLLSSVSTSGATTARAQEVGTETPPSEPTETLSEEPLPSPIGEGVTATAADAEPAQPEPAATETAEPSGTATSTTQSAELLGAAPAAPYLPPTPEPPAQPGSSLGYQTIPLVAGEPVHAGGETPPLRDLPQASLAPSASASSNQGGLAAPNIFSAAPFEGLSGTLVDDTPPNVTGDVGPNDYVQADNAGIAVFDKLGNSRGSWTFDDLMDPLGTSTKTGCRAGENHGDPSVIYDPVNDRWIVADLGWVDGATSPGPFYECIAFSSSSDPTGQWTVYNLFTDASYLGALPRIGRWSEMLLMSTNLEDCGDDNTCSPANQTAHGARVWVMGRISDLINFGILYNAWVDLPAYMSLLPSNVHGQNPPPSTVPGYGPPGYFVALTASGVNVWNVTYPMPPPSGTGVLSGPTLVSVDTGSAPPATIPQTGAGAAALDSVGGRLMMQAQYRNLGGTESLWLAHTVGNGDTPNIAGIRWYQLDVTGGTIAAAPVQSGTFQGDPADTTYRWLPSLAVDGAGNMAVGYSASSSSIHPQIRYAGRRWTDPANSLGQGEHTIVDASVALGSQTGSSAWGAHSSMTMDPTNDCTFWYTNEYYASNGADWKTRIGSFRLVRPTRGDFNCNGTTDLAVYRPISGNWFVKDQFSAHWGISTDIPVPGDYNGDGRADVAVYRPVSAKWFVLGQFSVHWGAHGDVLVPGDYNGDGVTDLAVFRPLSGTWFIKDQPSVHWGVSTDIPVPGDYNGDGVTDVAVYRPSSGTWFINGQPSVKWGISTDIPVPGDYNGDGTTDIAVWRPSNGNWYVQGQTTVNLGSSTDIPVPGDYDGNGTTDAAVFRPSNGTWYVLGGATTQWGATGDWPLPVPDTNGDGDPYQ